MWVRPGVVRSMVSCSFASRVGSFWPFCCVRWEGPACVVAGKGDGVEARGQVAVQACGGAIRSRDEQGWMGFWARTLQGARTDAGCVGGKARGALRRTHSSAKPLRAARALNPLLLASARLLAPSCHLERLRGQGRARHDVVLQHLEQGVGVVGAQQVGRRRQAQQAREVGKALQAEVRRRGRLRGAWVRVWMGGLADDEVRIGRSCAWLLAGQPGACLRCCVYTHHVEQADGLRRGVNAHDGLSRLTES